MEDYSNYFAWLADGGWIRISARALIFNHARDQILIERNGGPQNVFANFIGGGLEVGETLQACLAREITEETNASVLQAKHLFFLEHFMPHQTGMRHSIEHYFEISLDRTDIYPNDTSVKLIWTPIDALGVIDLRPVIVRDRIIDGTYVNNNHLVLGDGNGRSAT